MERATAILNYWFGNATDELAYTPDSPFLFKWFRGSAAQDEEIRQNFAKDHARAVAWELSDWAESLRGRQALVILYNQFTRSLYRGTAKIFDFDTRAQSLARRSLADGSAHRLPFIQQLFMIAPLGQSETLDDQEMYLAWIQNVLEEAKAKKLPSIGFWTVGAQRAQVYYETIQKFGRFPQRNALLHRQPTTTEIQFLPGLSDDHQT